MVAFLAIWQLGNKLIGIPYPSDLLYSNPGWAILTTQQFGLVPRINGPFSEPAALAGYMAPLVCSCGWAILQGHRSVVLRLLLLSGVMTMIISTSTSGFALLAIISCGVPIYAIARGDIRMISRILKIGVPLVLIGGLIVFATSVISPKTINDLQNVVDATLNKQDSASYNERTTADADSLTAFEDSFGLGAGWGSNRSSSLVPGILASLGIPGVAGLIWFAHVLVKRVRRARRTAGSQDYVFVIDICCGALIGTIMPALLAGPTINSVTFYFLLGLLISCVVRAEIDSPSHTNLRAV
jgi:energy-coupling factor transporter transmembrane protein EcfT